MVSRFTLLVCSYNMDKGKAKESMDEKKSQFRWSKPMSKVLLTFLASEVRKGHRPNNVFKSSSLLAAANEISKKFDCKCLPDHVDNHLRTVKGAWAIISKLRDKDSGFGWDDKIKMIRASPSVYDSYIQANPTHDKYLNKKIELYDEMAIVVGKDTARGNFSKSFDDVELQSRENVINLEDKGDDENEIVKDDKQSASSNVQPLESRRTRKRAREVEAEVDPAMQLISTQLGLVAEALQKFKLDIDQLYKEIMKMEGYEEGFLGSAFDYLVEHENQAKGFLAKSENLRKIWLENYKEKNF